MSEPKIESTSKRSLIKICGAGLLTAIALPILTEPLLAFAANAPASANAPAQAKAKGKKMLVVYYSWSGNTKYVAEQIQALTGADIFELKTVDPYPKGYRLTTEQARKELDSGYRPPLSSKIANLADYDTIFIGSPNWWGTLAMPLFTFLDANNMAGKTVAPFMTHEGSDFGKAIIDLKVLCPNATIIDGLTLKGGRVKKSKPEITQWLKKIGMVD